MTGSLRAYSKHRHVSVEAVSKAVETGRIADAVLGTEGRSTIIDFEKADLLWEKNTQVSNGVKSSLKPVAPTSTSLKQHDKRADDPDPAGVESIVQANQREAIADANLKELKYKTAIGQYLLADDVLKRFRAHGAMHSAAREGLPSQLAPQLVGLTDLGQIEKILRDALRQCDTRVADEIAQRYGVEGEAVEHEEITEPANAVDDASAL